MVSSIDLSSVSVPLSAASDQTVGSVAKITPSDMTPVPAMGAQRLAATGPSGLVASMGRMLGIRRLMGSVLALDHEVRASDGPCQLRLWRANLNELNSVGTSIPSESLNPTARFGSGPSSVYRTLIESPLS